MTIVGDIDALLSGYMSDETAENVTVAIFHFLSDADVISRLRKEGHTIKQVADYLDCVATLRRIVPNKSRREDAA